MSPSVRGGGDEEKLTGWTLGKMVWGTLVLLVVIFLVLSLFDGWVIVRAGSRGVVTHAGRVTGEVLDPGPHMKWPLYTGVKKFNCRVMAAQVEAGSASKDLQTIAASIVVNWHPDPTKVMDIFNDVGDEDNMLSGIMQPALNEIVKANTAQFTAEEVVSKRFVLKDSIDKAFAERMKKYNVIVDDLNIVHLDFGKAFNDAIEAKQVAEQESKQAKYVSDKAKFEAEAIANRAHGEAEAQRLQRASLTKEIIELKAVEKWDGHFPQVMGSGTLPFIDIGSGKFAASLK